MEIIKAFKISSTKILQLQIIDDKETDDFEFRISQLYGDPVELITDEKFVNQNKSIGISLLLNKVEYIQLIGFLGEFIRSTNEEVADKIDVVNDVKDWLENPTEE